MLDRRRLITGGAAVVSFAGLARHAHAQTQTSETYINETEGYGALIPDPNGLRLK